MAKAPPWATLVAAVSPLQPRERRYVFGLGDIIPGLVVRVGTAGDLAFSLKYQRDGCQKWYAVGVVKVASGARTGLTREQILTAGCRAVWSQASTAHLRLVAGGDPHDEHLRAKRERMEKARERARRVSLTFRTFLSETYFPHYLSQRRSGEATKKRLQSAFHPWQNRDISALTPWDLAKWRKERLDTGATPETVNRDITALRSMMNWAVHQGHIEANPLGRIRALGRTRDNRIRYLSPDERQRLQAALEGSEGYIAPLVTLALHTGLRRGELFSLQWGDVDLERRQLTIRLTTTKAAKTRHVPLNRQAMQALEHWRPENPRSDALVFPGRRRRADGQLIEGRLVDIKHGFTSLLKKAGITDFRFHDCRHDFASQLVMTGTDLNTVRELLGHSDMKQTLVYAHLAPQHKQAAVDRLDHAI